MSVALGMGRSTGRSVIAEGVGVIAGGGEANPIRRGVTMLQECRSGEALMRFIIMRWGDSGATWFGSSNPHTCIDCIRLHQIQP